MAYDTRHRTRVRLLTGRMDFVSNENREVAGSDDGIGNTARVGNAERDKAIALLGEHWRAGRLDPGEHELRVTRARAAATRADLGVLFADLPPPPGGPGGGPARSRAPQRPPRVPGQQARHDHCADTVRRAGLVLPDGLLVVVLDDPRHGDPAVRARRKEETTSSGALISRDR